MKFVELVAVPPGVVTRIGPVVAVAGTVAVIRVAEFTVNVADTPLKVTEVAPVNPVPVMTTLVPTGPLVGLNDVIVGAGWTVKFVELVAVPPGVVTRIGPVVAVAGTVAVICVSELKTNAADTLPGGVCLLKVTELAPVNPVPVMTTVVPTGPLVGLNEVIVGTGDGVTSKFVALAAVPSESVTSIGPSVAPAGTVAVICVSELTVKVAATLLNSTSFTTDVS